MMLRVEFASSLRANASRLPHMSRCVTLCHPLPYASSRITSGAELDLVLA